jgi:hypothetical protein
MAMSQNINICVFNPLRSSNSPVDGHVSAHIDTEIVNTAERQDALLSSLTLTAWGLLLKYYMATDLVSFASSRMKYLDIVPGDDDSDPQDGAFDKCASQDWIHNLEIGDGDRICSIIQDFQKPTSRHCVDAKLLPFINTIVECRSNTVAFTDKENTRVQGASPDFARQVCLISMETKERI